MPEMPQRTMKTLWDPARGLASDRLNTTRKLGKFQPLAPRHSISFSSFLRIPREPRGTLLTTVSLFLFMILLDVLLLCGPAAAAQVPGESQTGILYALTHLHPIAYIILFVIVVLAAVNLAYQGHFARGRTALAMILHRESAPAVTDDSRPETTVRPAIQPRPRRKNSQPRSASGENEQNQEGLVGPARTVRSPMATVARQPTPLDGINHTLPVFSSRGGNGVAVTDKAPDKPTPSTEFRFTSAVEVPPPDEIQRREREQLVVTGAVCGPDGKGLGAVIVYLADDQGNRVGQSCRSLPETGEFKVHVNSPGQYVLHGYKRGFVEDLLVSAPLPVESGKIEGYMLRMVPEGCTIHGRVLLADPELSGSAGMEVRCVCKDGAVGGSVSTDDAGQFRIFGVSSEAVCHLEVRNANGEVLHCSEKFETAGHKDLRLEVAISAGPACDDESQGAAEAVTPSENGHGLPDPPVPPVTGPAS